MPNSRTNDDRPADHVYGRRVEADRSWTVYHVFTGIPARTGSGAMTGLSRIDATDRMMSLNRHSISHRARRLLLTPPAIEAMT